MPYAAYVLVYIRFCSFSILMAALAGAASISRIFMCFDNNMGPRLFNSFLVSSLFYGPSVWVLMCTEISVMSVVSFSRNLNRSLVLGV